VTITNKYHYLVHGDVHHLVFTEHIISNKVFYHAIIYVVEIKQAAGLHFFMVIGGDIMQYPVVTECSARDICGYYGTLKTLQF